MEEDEGLVSYCSDKNNVWETINSFVFLLEDDFERNKSNFIRDHRVYKIKNKYGGTTYYHQVSIYSPTENETIYVNFYPNGRIFTQGAENTEIKKIIEGFLEVAVDIAESISASDDYEKMAQDWGYQSWDDFFNSND